MPITINPEEFLHFRRCVTIEECRNISAPVTMESTKKRMLIVENMCRVDCPFGQEIGSLCHSFNCKMKNDFKEKQ